MDKYVVQYLQLQKDKYLQNPINTIKTEDLIMTRQEFDNKVVMAVEIEYACGGRDWTTMKSSEVKDFIDRHEAHGDYLSDIDYAGNQVPEVREVLDKAWKLFMEDTSKYGSYDKAIESLLTEEVPEESKPSKRVWTAEEIKNLVQTNDKVLYGALKNLYNCQTSDEQSWGETTHANGVGFNAFDAEFLTSVAQFLIRNGFLTDKQKVLTRKKLVKYNSQLTRLANA